MAAGIWMLPGPPWADFAAGAGPGGAGEFAAQRRSGDPGLRLAKLFVAGGERGSPDSARGDKALKNLSASGVDDEALIARGAGADVGEIDPWPAHERPCQHISLRLETPFDLAGKRGAPQGGGSHWAVAAGTKAKAMSPPSAEPAKQRRSAPFILIVMLRRSRVPVRRSEAPNAARLRRRCGGVPDLGANAQKPINFA